MQPTQLGPYKILDVLGKGGMGTVYRAIDQRNEQEVAVKVLAASFADVEGFRERFQSEIDSLEQLRHPHIVQLFGYGEQEGQLYYAMELMTGNSLQDELAAGRRYNWREVTQFGLNICGALKHAHDHGIIHRDLKPANLLLDEQETVKLSDFGIAKLFGNVEVTAGTVLGTVDYMAPEQADGAPVTVRSDLYSLGCVMYALLAGRPPFKGKSIPEVIHKVRYDTPLPVRRLVPETPQELEQVIDELLSKDPAKRIPTPLALSKRLHSMQAALRLKPTEQESSQTELEADDLFEQDTWSADSIQQQSVDETQDVVAASSSSSVVPRPRRTRFVAVGQERRADESASTDSLPSILAKSILMLGLLAFIGWAVWRILTPPSADEVYADVSAAAEAGKLLQEQIAVDEFLRRFPDDVRSAQMRDWRTDIDLARFQQRADRDERGSKSLSTIEYWLARAMRMAPSDPNEAVNTVTALLAAFGSAHAELSDQDRRSIRLAERYLKQLRQRQHSAASEHLRAIQSQLQAARRLQASDPAAARQILRGLVTLYGSQPWAKEAMEDVQRVLEVGGWRMKDEGGRMKDEG